MKPYQNFNFAFPAVLLALAIIIPITGHTQSLADLSRSERARKKPGSVKTYSNDNIPAATLSGSAASPAAASAAGAATTQSSPAAGEQAGAPKGKTAEETEKEYREKFAKLKETQTYEERKLDVQQRELNLSQQQFYSDPNVALREQTFRSDINQRTADIEKQKEVVEKAKKDIADLEQELKQKNLPAGWAR